jgi:drug/metabolite transporter (DMT)-like permease
MDRKALLKGYTMVILSALLFGCMPLITKYLYAEGINRESVVLMRNLFSLPAHFVLALCTAKSLKIPVRSVPYISILALMGCCITPLLLYGSYQYISTGTATVFHFVYPAAVVLIGLIFLRKKINPVILFAVALCVAGICMFYDPNGALNLKGSGLALISGVTFAIYIVLLSSSKYREITGFKLSFYVALVCSVAMMLVCVIGNKLIVPTTARGWILGVLLALLINVGAVVMFQKGTHYIGGERASVLSTVEPLTGVFVGVLAFDEKLTAFSVVGVILVLASCVMIALNDRKG